MSKHVITCGRGDHLLVKLAREASSSSASRALDELARQASSSRLEPASSSKQHFTYSCGGASRDKRTGHAPAACVLMVKVVMKSVLVVADSDENDN